jgi:hypothetical protein
MTTSSRTSAAGRVVRSRTTSSPTLLLAREITRAVLMASRSTPSSNTPTVTRTTAVRATALTAWRATTVTIAATKPRTSAGSPPSRTAA